MRLSNYKLLLQMIFVLVCSLKYNQTQSQIPNRTGKCYTKFVDSGNPKNLDTSISIYYVLSNKIKDENIDLKRDEYSIDVKNELWIRAYKNSSYDVLWELNNQSNGFKIIHYLSKKNRKKLDSDKIDTIQIEVCQIIPNVAVWNEVICNENITIELLQKIARALIEKGYELSVELENGSEELINSLEFKQLLIQFQKDNNLSQGGLTNETLNVLEIRT